MKSEALFESKKEIVMDEKTGRAVIVNKADDKDSKQSLLNESNSPIGVPSGKCGFTTLSLFSRRLPQF
uniref:hypothetical protein n=1 Tax=Staphylococcus aureus TaxID=1280 RepID=UPI0015EE5C85|nr:hypothetical protein [Staphylococcus aureus]